MLLLRLPFWFAPARDSGRHDRAAFDGERGYAQTRDDDEAKRALTELRDENANVAARGFEALFTTYYTQLCDLAFRYLHSRDEAQDVVQDVFVRLWRGRTTLKILDAAAGYLRTATRNNALNRLRHARVEGVVDGDLAHVVSDGAIAADETLERAERHAAIARAIADLPDRRRAVCLLRWGKGMSYAEIAKQLGIGERTVETHLRRAIQTVRGQISEE